MISCCRIKKSARELRNVNVIEICNYFSFFKRIQGDSGGPFVCNEGGSFVLRGAVSWGHSSCRTDHYTVFARVSSFIGWINNKMPGNFKKCLKCLLVPYKCVDLLH